jgi:hypothetical protein
LSNLDYEPLDVALLLPNIAIKLASIKIHKGSLEVLELLKEANNLNITKLEKEIDDLKRELSTAKTMQLTTMLQSASYNRTQQPKPKCYIMIDGATKYVKIGKSINPENRERTLQSEKPTIKMIHVFNNDIEKILHQKYNDKRLRGEWFDLTEDEVNHIIKTHK